MVGFEASVKLHMYMLAITGFPVFIKVHVFFKLAFYGERGCVGDVCVCVHVVPIRQMFHEKNMLPFSNR